MENPMKLFVSRPDRIFIVAVCFFAAYLLIWKFRWKFPSLRSWPLLVSTIVWVLYAVWEWYCTIQKYNIRVDLLFIYPFLIAITAFGLLLSVSGLISALFLKKR